jgi:RND family efflux transporter MFP subunit
MNGLLKLSILASMMGASLVSLSLSANQVVRYGMAQHQELQARHRVVGTLKAVNQANVAASEAGKITKVMVNEGDLVKKDQALVILDQRRLKAQLAQVEAQLAKAQAELAQFKAQFEQAEYDYLAYQKSAQKSAVSEQRLKQAKTQTLVAQANVIAAMQALEALEAERLATQVRLDDMIIKAPFSGQVTKRFAEPGQWLASGDSAITLVSQDKLEAWLDVPERFSYLTQQHTQAIALQAGNLMVEGNNVKTIAQVDERARTFQVVASVNNVNLMPGMSISAWIPEGDKRTTLVVPKDAIVERGGQALVYKVTEEGDKQTAMAVNVTVQFHHQGVAAVYAPGLTRGDKVITEGNERLMPGPVMAVADSKGLNSTASLK